MKRRLLLVSLILACAGAVALWFLFDPEAREVRKVQRRLLALASEVSFPEGESALRKLSYGSRVSAFFTDPTDLSLSLGQRSHDGMLTRSQLEEGAGGVRAVSRGLQVVFLDIAVQLDPDHQRATAHLTSKIEFKGEPDYWVQEFRFKLVRQQGAWAVSRIETVRTMRR